MPQICVSAKRSIKYISNIVVDLKGQHFKWVLECIDMQVEAAKCEVGRYIPYDNATWYITSCLHTYARTLVTTVKL